MNGRMRCGHAETQYVAHYEPHEREKTYEFRIDSIERQFGVSRLAGIVGRDWSA